jgi:hypothetical protein
VEERQTHEFPVPVQVAWDYITSPVRRPVWSTGVTEVIEDSPSGRRGAGTTNHCMHGRDAILEEVLDWRPPHYWLTRVTAPFLPGSPQVLLSDELVDLPGGRTRVTSVTGRPEGLEKETFAAIWAPFRPAVEQSYRDLETALADEGRRLTEESRSTVQLPKGRARHIAEPVRDERAGEVAGGEPQP